MDVCRVKTDDRWVGFHPLPNLSVVSSAYPQMTDYPKNDKRSSLFNTKKERVLMNFDIWPALNEEENVEVVCP